MHAPAPRPFAAPSLPLPLTAHQRILSVTAWPLRQGTPGSRQDSGSPNGGLQRHPGVTGPHNVLGIEISDCAAELARVTLSTGELQWRIQRGDGFKLNPVLEAPAA